MIFVRPIESGEWRLYRDVRLRALRDSPDAFSSTHEAEAAREDETWSARISAAASSGNDRAFFACHLSEICGLAWCKLSASEPDVADIFQMWVDPASRGLGVGRALLKDAVAWAENLGVHRIRLGVTLADTPAMHLYKSTEFRPVGTLEPLREGSALFSQSMELEIRRIKCT